MTRVLVLSWEYPPLVEGGLGRHVGRLSEELAAQGHEVHVLTRGGAGPPPGPGRAGVRVHRVGSSATPWDLDRFLAWVEGLNAGLLAAGCALGAREAFDVVHGHDWLVGDAADGLARALGVPLVMTCHATEHGRHAGRVHQHPQDRIHAAERGIARRADAVIVCSRYMRAHVAEVFGLDESRVRAILNGVDPPAAVPARRPPGGPPLLLGVGRLVHEKGFQLVLEALPAVLEAAGDARLALAGSGPYEPELRALAAELGLLEHVVFLGWAGDEQLARLYAAADLCVVPSLFEPFGLVALEAMAAGCPVVAADTGGLREVVPDGIGVRVPVGDAATWGGCLGRLLTTDAGLRTTLAARGVAFAARFGWDGAARRTAEVYASAIAGRPR